MVLYQEFDDDNMAIDVIGGADHTIWRDSVIPEGRTTWTAVDYQLTCPETIQIDAADAPHLTFNFRPIVARHGAITEADVPIDKDGQSITVTNTSVSDGGDSVTFQFQAAAGTYTLIQRVTTSQGVLSRRGVVEVL